MRPMTLNMSKMKKIAGDKNTSTFQHDDGHQMIILHKVLPALQRKQIEKMPLAESDKTKKMAEGGALSSPDTSMTVPPQARDDARKGKKDDQAWQKPADDSGTMKAGEYKMYADGSEEPVAQVDSAPVADATAVAPQPMVAPNPINQMANVPIDPQVAPTVADRPLVNANGTANEPAVAALDLQAAKQKMNADIAQGAMEANINHGKNAAMVVQAQNDQDRYNELKGHADDFNRDMKFINPNHYMESKSTLGKVSTAIGLFLGGLGGGIAHTGGNAALDYLNRQIDRDIDAQKADNEKRKTIWGANQALYGEGNIASNMTKINMNTIYDGQMREMAAKLATPRAQLAYNAWHADMLRKNDELLKTSAASAALQRAGGTNLNIGPTPLNQGQPAPQKPTSATTTTSKGTSKAAAKTDPDSDHILRADAGQAFQNATTSESDVRFKGPEGELVRRQLTGAAMADKAIDAIKEHFPAMYEDITHGEYEPTSDNPVRAFAAGVANTIRQAPGWARHQAEDLEGIPYAGPAIAGAARAATGTSDNKDYDLHRNNSLAAITAALTQAGLSPTEAHESALKYMPIEGDSKQQIAEKIRLAVKKVRDSVPHEALDRHPELVRQRKK